MIMFSPESVKLYLSGLTGAWAAKIGRLLDTSSINKVKCLCFQGHPAELCQGEDREDDEREQQHQPWACLPLICLKVFGPHFRFRPPPDQETGSGAQTRSLVVVSKPGAWYWRPDQKPGIGAQASRVSEPGYLAGAGAVTLCPAPALPWIFV